MSSYLQEFFHKLETCVVSDEAERATQPLIRLCNGREKAKLYSPKEFNEIYKEFFYNKYENDDVLTETKNTCQVLNALNVLYLDIDYCVSSKTKLEENQAAIAQLYSERFIETNNIENYALFVYLPETIPLKDGKYKCGAHIFVYLSENVNKTQRQKMFDLTKTAILENENMIDEIEEITELNITSESYDVLFDKGPLMSTNSLILFAQKIGATRHYKLCEELSVINEDLIRVIPTVHTVRKEVEIKPVDDFADISDEETKEILKENLDAFDEFVKSRVVKETLAFLESLVALCPTHPFWEILDDHFTRWQVINPVIDWLLLANFLDQGSNISENWLRIETKLALILRRLITFTVAENEPQKSNNLDKIYASIDDIIKKKMDKGDVWELMLDDELGDVQSAINNYGGKDPMTAIRGYIKRYNPGYKRDEVENVAWNYHGKLTKVWNYAMFIFINYSTFVKGIMGGLSFEIIPFKTLPPILRPGMDIRDKRYFLDGDIYREREKFRDYDNIIRRWFRMFIAVAYYNHTDPCESVREAILAFSKRFVSKMIDKNETTILIYNICQTPETVRFPRNQWIPDTKANDITIQWFSFLYNYYIDQELQTDAKSLFLDQFVKMMRTCRIINGRPKPLTTLSDFKSSMKTLSADAILKTSVSANIKPPVRKEICGSSPYFPMWNAIVEFVLNDTDYAKEGLKRGDIRVRDDNYDIYLDGFTTTPFTHPEVYNKNCPEYKRVKLMIEQTYADPLVREYVLRNVAQTLHSCGERDQFHQYFGQGSEGKSVWNDFVANMLGQQPRVVPVGLPNVSEMEIPLGKGLATTVNPEAITQIGSSSSHQSGGAIELMNRRFGSMSEPNTQRNSDINVSEIKKITGGSPMTSRQIQKAAVSFTPKCYLVYQTNKIMGYSETTDAVKRRLAVIPHESHFYTKVLAKDTVRTNLMFEADSELATNIKLAPKYWEALFQYLLPYAQWFIRENIGALSNIPRPQKIQDFMDISLSNSSGLNGFFEKNLTEAPDSCICVSDLVDYIFATNKSLRQNGDGCILEAELMKQPRSKQTDVICNVIDCKFGRICLYKVLDTFVDPKSKELKGKTIEIEGVERRIGFPLDHIPDELFEAVFGPRNEAISGIVMERNLDLHRVYIVGYKLCDIEV